MPLSEPYNWWLVTEQQYASMRPSCLCVPSMVFITKSVCQYSITFRHWLVTWDLFTGIPIKLWPVTIMKMVLIYGRVRRVKTQFTPLVRLQVPKYLKRLLKEPNACHDKVTLQRWRIKNNPMPPISAAQKSCPMSSWKLCTSYTFSSGESSNHGKYLLENGVTYFYVSLLPPLARLSSTLTTSYFTYCSDNIA